MHLDTTPVALASLLRLLALHPAVQDKLYAELKATLKEKNIEATIANTKPLVYLNAVINEALRCQSFQSASSNGRPKTGKPVLTHTGVYMSFSPAYSYL